MNKIDTIDYKLDKEITNELEKLIRYKIMELLKNTDTQELTEYIKIITSTEYNNTKEKQSADLRDVCDDEPKEKVNELILFIQRDLPSKYK